MTNVWIRRISCGARCFGIVGVLWLMVETSRAQQDEVAEAGKLS